MPEKPYDAKTIELKWHQRWQHDTDLYKSEDNPSKPKYYVLEMLPYPRSPGAESYLPQPADVPGVGDFP